MGKKDKSKDLPKEKHTSEQSQRKLNRKQTIQLANRELSCVATSKATARTTADNLSILQSEREKGHELAEHLRSIAPFNRRWQITETINEGSYGVVFAVKDVKTGTSGVIKVAKSKASGNETTEWEGFLLERIFRQVESASIVRVLDKGMLADQHEQGMEFIVLERAEISISDYLDEAKTLRERRLKVCDIAIQMLKGISDLHVVGLLHRDLKPDNMGVCSKERPIVLLFDLGMARMYTDGEGSLRPPRTTVCFRGTPEWASGHAQKSRDQTRFDDLIAWLYVVIELFDKKDTRYPLPWTSRGNLKATSMLKSAFMPARVLLRYCPSPFYAINSYLQTANRQKAPDYGFIADRLRDATEEVRKEPETATLTELSMSARRKKKPAN